MHLDNSDVLFLYTDGVTEAMNNEGELFSEERLENTLAGTGGKEVGKITELVAGELEAFTAGAPQTDDITMLVIRYLGGGKKST
jgi:sigma-B regulation protein RsbU (phosphoserine phosphatase)